MANLPSIYTSNITIFESRVKAADSENLAQRQGKNLNYMYDQLPVLSGLITSESALALRAKLVVVTVSLSTGLNTIYTTPAGQKIYSATGFTVPPAVLPPYLWVSDFEGYAPPGSVDHPVMSIPGTDDKLYFYVYGAGYSKTFSLVTLETAV